VLKLSDADTLPALRAVAYKELAHGTADERIVLELLKSAVEEVSKAEPGEEQVNVYLEYVNQLTHLNRLEEAREFARKADDILAVEPASLNEYRSVRRARLEAQLSLRMGLIYHLGDRYLEAREHYERGYAKARALGARFTVGYASDMLGKLAHLTEDWDRAEQHFLEASEVWSEIGNFIAPAATLNRALMEADRGSGPIACLLADEAATRFRENGSERMATLCMLQGAYCYARHGDWAGMEERLAPAFSRFGYTLIDRETLQLFRKTMMLAISAGEEERVSDLCGVVLRRAEELEQDDLVAWARGLS